MISGLRIWSLFFFGLFFCVLPPAAAAREAAVLSIASEDFSRGFLISSIEVVKASSSICELFLESAPGNARSRFRISLRMFIANVNTSVRMAAVCRASHASDFLFNSSDICIVLSFRASSNVDSLPTRSPRCPGNGDSHLTRLQAVSSEQFCRATKLRTSNFNSQISQSSTLSILHSPLEGVPGRLTTGPQFVFQLFKGEAFLVIRRIRLVLNPSSAVCRAYKLQIKRR